MSDSESPYEQGLDENDAQPVDSREEDLLVRKGVAASLRSQTRQHAAKTSPPPRKQSTAPPPLAAQSSEEELTSDDDDGGANNQVNEIDADEVESFDSGEESEDLEVGDGPPHTIAWETGTMTCTYPNGTYVKVCPAFPPEPNVADCPTQIETGRKSVPPDYFPIQTNPEVENTLMSCPLAVPQFRSMLVGAVKAVRARDMQNTFKKESRNIGVAMDNELGRDHDICVFEVVKASPGAEHELRVPVVELKTKSRTAVMASDMRVPHLRLCAPETQHLIPDCNMDVKLTFGLSLNALLDATLRRHAPNDNFTTNMCIGFLNDGRKLLYAESPWVGNFWGEFSKIWPTAKASQERLPLPELEEGEGTMAWLDSQCLMNCLLALVTGIATKGCVSSDQELASTAEATGARKDATIKVGRGLNLCIGSDMVVGKGCLWMIPRWLEDPKVPEDVKAQVLLSDLEQVKFAVESQYERSRLPNPIQEWRKADTKPTHEPFVSQAKCTFWARVDGIWREARRVYEGGFLPQGANFQRKDRVAYFGTIDRNYTDSVDRTRNRQKQWKKIKKVRGKEDVYKLV